MRVRFRLAIGAPQSPLTRWIVLSLLAHLLGALLWIGVTRRSAPRKPPLPESISVVLAAAPRVAKARAAGGGPRVTAPQPTPPAVPPKPLPTRKPALENKPLAKPPPKPTPSTSQDTQPSAVPVTANPPPAPSGSAGTAGAGSTVGDEGASVSAVDLGGSELAWYRDAVSGRLYETWRQPLLDAVRDALEVQIRFAIAPDGRVVDPRVDRSSGVPSLDRSALRAVSDVSPLPPLPRGWRDSPLEASFVFRLFPEDR